MVAAGDQADQLGVWAGVCCQADEDACGWAARGQVHPNRSRRVHTREYGIPSTPDCRRADQAFGGGARSEPLRTQVLPSAPSRESLCPGRLRSGPSLRPRSRQYACILVVFASLRRLLLGRQDHRVDVRDGASLARSGGLELRLDGVPVDDVPPGREVVRPSVLIVEVVGVLPDVDAEERRLPLHHGRVLAWG